MNAPIRCEPSLISGAVPAPPVESSAQGAAFGDLLSSELDSDPAPERAESEAEPRRKEEDAQPWTILGFLPFAPVLPRTFLQATPPPANSRTAADAAAEVGISDAAGAQPGGEQPATAEEGEAGDAALMKMLAAPTQQKMPGAPGQPTLNLEQIAEKLVKPGEKASGIAAAKEAAMPPTSANSKEISPAGEKAARPLEALHALHSRDSIVAVETGAPRMTRAFGFPEKTTNHGESADRFEIGAGFHLNVAMAAASPGEPVEIQTAPKVEMASAIETIREHAHILKASTHDRLEVMLRPDSQTQIVVEVRKIDGHIEVRARCERGDFQFLDAHWKSVRGALETQGMRVEPLFASGQSFSPDSGSNERGARHARPERAEIFPVRLKQKNSSTARPGAARPSAARGWQTWA